MNEEAVEKLYEELSDLHGVPMPIYIFYDRRPEVLKPRVIPSWAEHLVEQIHVKITISLKIGVHFQFKTDIPEDPFGLICLSKGSRGIRKDEAVHEFFHYYDYLINFFTGTRPVDEASAKYRTRKYMKATRAYRGT